MEKYRVYVGAIQKRDEKIKYSFCDPNMARMLVFSSKKPNGDFRLLKSTEQNELSRQEITWLNQSRMCIAMNNASQSANELAQNMNRLLDILEDELKKEKEAMSNGAKEKADGESTE